ncbi:DUF2867 domain-containing protein [Maridesulfovibrio sp. FT414]|uniref:DUF2867 domain-containing protein n=1 Tax=Maridesulfovibrio sp. FT414 TaxID=2979469 RepID=UPI003D80697A
MTDSIRILESVESISALLENAGYVDVKAFTSRNSMHDFLIRLMTYQPYWLTLLYRIRGVVADLFGLKHDELFKGNSDVSEYDFNAGGRVDFFTSVDFKPEKYWIGEATDRHLSGCIGVVAEPEMNGNARFYIFTIVHYRHWTGPLYFNLIRPFHHIVVYFMGKYAAKKV